jgi:hypothetical protein
MVNRIRTTAPGNTRQTQDTSSPSQLLSSNRTRPTEQHDDLIVSLAERYENRRARQVGEWERLYGENVYRAL